jgi:malate dehydrogenase (oxaloacetate-decarboxylating)
VSADFTYRLRIPHVSGTLERVTGTIAREKGLIGDIETITVSQETSLREITVEVEDDDHAERMSEALAGMDGVDVLGTYDRALVAHEGGKLGTQARRPLRTFQDTRDVYTPGVARACRAIERDPAAATDLTMIPRSVAICTNGTRVLGLGDIGPVAAMPVMEGKALFYTEFVDIAAIPILVDTREPEVFVETVIRIAPTFGGIHLEDISAPECYEIEARLIDALDQPVMHDDVHGTAAVVVGAAMLGCEQVGLEFEEATVGQIGLGAAGLGTASLMVEAGVRRVIASDPNEETHATATERGIAIAEMDEVMRDCDLVVASSGVPGLIQPGMVREGQIILALSNPDPEIRPRDALDAGAAFATDGSVVNNALGYPGIFRGALLAGASTINSEMKLAAARRIAELASESELMPNALSREVHAAVTAAVRAAAVSSGVGRPERSPPEGDADSG